MKRVRKPGVVLSGLAVALLALPTASSPANAADDPVAAVTGRSIGYHADEISLFGGGQDDTGPIPSAALAYDASNSPQAAAGATGLVEYGPAKLFTSDTITLSTSGSLGATGSVTSSSDIQNINSADSQPATGSEVFGYPPEDPQGRRTALAGTCTASASGLSGSTVVTNGMVRTHAQGTDSPSGGGHTHDPANPEGEVTIPTDPPANYKVAGHVHLNSTVTDYFVIVFNEQIVNPDGELTVNPIHEYFGAKLNEAGDIVKDAPHGDGGSILHGHLYLGQLRCGVSTDPNAPPDAVDDGPSCKPPKEKCLYTMDEDTQLSVAAPGVLGNDTDADGDPLTAALATGPTHGTVSLGSDGSFVYTPDPDYPGAVAWAFDSFTYTASDGKLTATATVRIRIDNVEDYPRATDDSYRAHPGVPLNVPEPGVLANDYDAEGNPMSVFIPITPPQNGTVRSTNNAGGFTYVPNPGFIGVDVFTYKVFEFGQTEADMDIGQVTINVTDNVPPDAVDDAYTTNEETPLTIAAAGVLANDSDEDQIDAGNLKAALATGPANGTVTVNQNGSFAYTPAFNFAGTDSFTYTARDLRGTSDTATVRITVNQVNDVPDAVDDSYATNEDTSLTVRAPGLLGNDTDPDGDALVSEVAAEPAHGEVVVGPNGSFNYGPAPDYNGPDSFTYTVSDGNGGTDTATVAITVTAVNDAPKATDDAYAATEDTVLTVAAPGVLGNDTDAEADPMTAGSATVPSNGSVALNSDGSFVYTPNPNFDGSDSFTYTVSDGLGGTDTATVTVAVAGVNDAPVATDDAYTTAAGTPLTVSAPGPLGNDTDVDGDTLTAGSASDPAGGSVTLNGDGSFTYTPDAGFVGTDTFTYAVSDGNGGSASATVSITVTPPPPTGDTRPTQLSVSDLSVAEGDAGTTTATFTITRAGVLSGPSTVKYKTSGGTATAGTDYTALTTLATLSFVPGETTKTVPVAVIGDNLPEANETFNLVLSAPTGAVLADASGTATIRNDDGAAYLAVNNVTVSEGDSGTTPATFTVTRLGNTNGSSSVKYKTNTGTAGTADFTTVPLNSLSFAAGETTKAVTVDVTGDTTDENNETFTLALSAPVGATIADTAGTATIVDDEGTVTPGPATFVSVDNVVVNEGSTGTTAATFTFTRTGNTGVASTVKYKTSGGTATAGTDYTAITALGSLSFAAGETTKTVSVDVAGDGLPEGDETFNLVLSAPTGAVIADTSGTATIANDDGAAYLAVDNVAVNEGNTGTSQVGFTVSRSGNTTGASTVNVKTSGGTAIAGTDYTAVPLTAVEFAAGETTKTVVVAITGDTTKEPNETFNLVLSSPTGAVTSDTSGTATILSEE